MNVFDYFRLRAETRELQELGRKIRKQRLSEDELVAAENRCATRSLEVQHVDLRVTRAFTRHVVRIERLRRGLVPDWTRAEMLAMAEPDQLVTQLRVDACLQWLWASERAFSQHAHSVDAQFNTYISQLRATAPADAGIASMVEKLEKTRSQHRHLKALIAQELQVIQQLHATARPLASEGRLRTDGQGRLVSDEPDFVAFYEGTRAQLAALEAQSTVLLQEMDILPLEDDGAPAISTD